MECRSSISWFDPSSSQRKYRSVPFVSRSGKFSLHTLCVWRCYPEQLLASLSSTVYSRLLSVLRKRFGFALRSRLMNCAFKTAVTYTLTRHNWIIDRFLGMSRKGVPIKHIENHVHFCVSELDENKRFVYSQAYFQANWLKFQVFRPRDKSRDESRVGTHLRNLGFTSASQLCDNNKLAKAAQISSDLWEVDAYVSTGRERAHRIDSDSEFSHYLSETQYYNMEAEDFFSSDEE